MNEPQVPRPGVLDAILRGPVIDHHRASAEGEPFSGGPLPADDIRLLADLVAQTYRLDKMSMRIERGLAAPYELHTLIAVVWAGGFKAGAEHARSKSGD